jgi:hypothetical protein
MIFCFLSGTYILSSHKIIHGSAGTYVFSAFYFQLCRLMCIPCCYHFSHYEPVGVTLTKHTPPVSIYRVYYNLKRYFQILINN